jgi:hypothetical protein
MFVLYGLIGLVTIPLAFLLPSLRAAASDGPAARRWTLTPLNALFFVVSFGADGVLGATISVLLAQFMPTTSAIIGAGLLLALQRLIAIVLALFSGPLTDRLGAHRLLLPCTLAIAAGFAVIAGGYVSSGTIIVILARALLGTAGPVLAAEKSTDRIAGVLRDVDRRWARRRRLFWNHRHCRDRLRHQLCAAGRFAGRGRAVAISELHTALNQQGSFKPSAPAAAARRARWPQ